MQQMSMCTYPQLWMTITSKNTKFWVKYPHHIYVISTNIEMKFISVFFLWSFMCVSSLPARRTTVFFFLVRFSLLLSMPYYISIFMNFDMYICYKDVIETQRLEIKFQNTVHLVLWISICYISLANWENVGLGFIRRKYFSKKKSTHFIRLVFFLTATSLRHPHRTTFDDKGSKNSKNWHHKHISGMTIMALDQ